MRGPGIEPGSTAWKAAMLTITPATLLYKITKMRQPGVEPGAKAWEASMLPIHHWRGQKRNKKQVVRGEMVKRWQAGPHLESSSFQKNWLVGKNIFVFARWTVQKITIFHAEREKWLKKSHRKKNAWPGNWTRTYCWEFSNAIRCTNHALVPS